MSLDGATRIWQSQRQERSAGAGGEDAQQENGAQQRDGAFAGEWIGCAQGSAPAQAKDEADRVRLAKCAMEQTSEKCVRWQTRMAAAAAGMNR